MLPFDLFRIPLFTLSVWTSVCSYAAQILAYVSLPFLFETAMHLSAVETGFLVTPWPFMTAVTAPIAGRLTIRYPGLSDLQRWFGIFGGRFASDGLLADNPGEVGCRMAVGPLRYRLWPFPDAEQHCDDDGWTHRA
jgi:DHA2 family multidrug resistance protein-like MFS transporter